MRELWRGGPGVDEGESYPTGVKPGAATLTRQLSVQRRARPDVASSPPLEGPYGFVNAYPPVATDEHAPFPDARPMPWLAGADVAVQRRGEGDRGDPAGSIHRAAAAGTSGAGGPLPFADEIQPLFGRHDISTIGAHTDARAASSARAIGAEAYAVGDQVAFGEAPTLHTAAHEAAHVVQQRAGVSLKGGVGEAGDAYERHADAVADRVVRGESAEELLDAMAGAGGGGARAVQRTPGDPAARPTPAAADADAGPAAPTAGINKPGFIDHSDGSNIRTGPAEAGGTKVREEPLPPATRVFVTGTHPSAPEWLYVTATLDDRSMVRGYVQNFRVNTDLPEPLAELYQIESGDTPRAIASRKFSGAVRDGHDLRYYENVLLHVNRDKGRTGIRGSFQDPGITGGGDNNIELVAGQRIWLVSPAFAKALEGVVPDGSLTGGAVAKAKRFAGHIEDILKSVTESPSHFGEVAGEYAEAIKEHLPEIIGIVAGFIAAEALSAFLAATPTGVGQLAAIFIQLALAAFGAAGAVTAGVQALDHAGKWLTLAWTASGKAEQIAQASKEFLKMLVQIAMAALAILGVRANWGKALAIAETLPPMGMVPAAVAVGAEGAEAGAGAGTGVALGAPGPAGPLGTAMATTGSGKGGSSTPSTKPSIELPASMSAKLKKVIETVVERAKAGKLKKAGNYHPHFDDAKVLEILQSPDAIYLSEGKSGRLIFRKGSDIVVLEGSGSGQGNVITGYGPSGIKGESGAAALGGAATDAGLPITHDMIVNGTVPVAPGRPPVPAANQVAP